MQPLFPDPATPQLQLNMEPPEPATAAAGVNPPPEPAAAAESPPWQSLALAEISRPSRPSLRMSGSGKCLRQMTYAAAHTPETDPPDRHSENRMALGHMAEILIVKQLKENGWSTKHTVIDPGGQLELTVEVAGQTATGHPDGICAHPEFTKGQWLTLECKSMSVERGRAVAQNGIKVEYPHYMYQIAIYGQELKLAARVDQAHHGIFAMIDRDGRPIGPEQVSWDPDFPEQVEARMAEAQTRADRDDLPERPYVQDSLDCRFCNYTTLCWSDAAAPEAEPIDRETLTGAAAEWLEAKPKVDQARDQFAQAVDAAGGRDITAGGVTGGYFIPQVEYDVKRLQDLVPLNILRQCVRQRPGQKPDRRTIWIRKERR